ncbi:MULTISPECIES: helix-turn-helix domain-containing protein [unclassified Rhodococcus (in: high G+C Gram-positive bacteria)]|uniref:helix-turn-helix domain-containing protein n=1 Tax=unclassified Rhodococcus (in: high G+C Gram-positive bacteria) TaxID=192944 RepID=UPI0016399EDA|nr:MULTISPECIES: helix-turn-helix domain-containing protein [unclassified Rhodococcus (in: high G+C Gram-positive bacteria)]MBC2639665.1 helix-turn-helix domain-containing protein [Rhodococcus sp. 3A]MBC2895590.1 helix-turn-helix domain-containing protein [Rhodococcus sp. 4CII]
MKRPQQLSTIEDAARYLNVSTRTIRRMITDGKITGYRIGSRAIRVDLDALFDAVARPMGMSAA